MASISKIRYTNVIYENGNKRYNDELFKCAGHNTAILLENGGGKTVFIQAALQAVLPHTDLGERKAKETFVLEGEAAHIAIEWIISEKPRRYALTAVTLFLQNNELKSYKYVYEYGIDDKNSIEYLPFTQPEIEGGMRAASKGEIREYYTRMAREYMTAKTFETNKAFHEYIEDHFKIIADEWRSIALINGEEGGVDAFFDGCKTTSDLVEKLLLPTIEQGLMGSGSEEFAATFEAQREHFKKHKQLERSIKESQKIKTEIENYVKSYGQYDTKVKAYEAQKQDAKSLWEKVIDQEAFINQELKKIRLEEEKNESEKQKLDQKSNLIEVTVAKHKWEEAKEQFEKADSYYQHEKELLQDKEARRHILKLADFSHQIEEAKAQIKINNEQLEALKQDEEAKNLSEALENNSSLLHGYYKDKLQNIATEKQRYTNEKERYLLEEKQVKEETEKLIEKINTLEKEASKLEGFIERNHTEMEKIKKAILAQGEYDEVEEQYNLWCQRIAELEAHYLELCQKLKDNEMQAEKLKALKEEKNKRRTQCLEQLSMLQVKIGGLEQAAQKVLEEVKKALPSLYSLSSIYAKPQQVMTTLEEQIEKYEREKEEALLLERQHARFIENYEAHSYFTIEPLLESFTDQWYSEFTYIQTGTAFVLEYQNEEVGMRALQEPKWAQLLIVADGQEEKLLAKLKEKKESLTEAVGVMTLTEAKQALENGFEAGKIIYPLLWEKMMAPEAFLAYKKEAASSLEAAVKVRKEKEYLLRQMQETLSKVRNFLEAYPHEEYASWRQESDRLRGEEARIVREMEEVRHEEEGIEKENKAFSDTMLVEGQEKSELSHCVEKAKDYLRLKNDNDTYEKQKRSIKAQCTDEEKRLDGLRQQAKRLHEMLEDIKAQLDQLSTDDNRLKEDPLYLEVKSYEASYSNESLSYLKERQKQLKDLLANKQKGRSEIERALSEALKKLKNNEKYYAQEMAETEGNPEIPSYKASFDDELDELNKYVKQLKKSVEMLEQEANKAKTEFDKKEQSYQGKKEEYEAQYLESISEIEDTEQAKKELSKARKKLKDKQSYLVEQTERLKKDESVILDSKHELELKDQVYGFCSPEVNATVSVKKINFIASLKETTLQMLKRLESLKQEKEKAYEKITERKESFRAFCQKEIADSKLRNMAVNGIKQKDDYEELMAWQKIMVERIGTTINILERDLLDQDKIISQFIIHLYTYLRTVRTELEEIPKKTRVKVQEGWKTIYEFEIPNWKEDEGKEKMRNHIYSLLDEIDGETFKNEQGEEDNQKIRKYVKEQFKLKQLLRIVMGNDTIKVKCRKVSSISSISSQKFSWETSTKWSGGEKWSKNMALYLGILNYLAEKKQNINQEENKISRAVILDNPFGKASSGHVLEPVFFIAKQIGFQIIALTAHSEGDFIRKYFPVVYSCKLREAKDHRTNIFTKEQEIRKAYFMDHDPVALSILGETSQIDLWGMK